ncbi:MAG: deoxyguanosinetriphosphate triphosphohydrolase [Gammaproteobacteria bacterium]|nr:deoxyguanosinetriphosphate triphosphohydrolase [Gammaproteobacteria bacterium]
MSAMSWEKLLSPKRHGHADEEPTPGRSQYHKDHDRIVFCPSFRRLGRKTQVHPLALNDHIHTRLTHSIEVGSVGRSLALRVGERLVPELPAWSTPHDLGVIVQSACLAHDIGNPPFGHTGEDAIRDWFKRPEHAYLSAELSSEERADLQTFEGNAQGFRLITTLENHLFDGGLRLTYATLGTTLKYPWLALKGRDTAKFSCYFSERERLDELGEALGLLPQGPHHWSRHPLSYLMEAADDICYALLDLEDAVELGILRFEDILPVLRTIAGREDFDDPHLHGNLSARRKLSFLRGMAIESMLADVVEAFFRHYDEILRGELAGDLFSHTRGHVRQGIAQAKQLARERVFNSLRKTEVEVGSYTVLGVLLEAFCKAAHEQHAQAEPSLRSRRILDLMAAHAPEPGMPLYQAYLRVLDFISGMTDSYATYLAHQVGGLVR